MGVEFDGGLEIFFRRNFHEGATLNGDKDRENRETWDRKIRRYKILSPVFVSNTIRGMFPSKPKVSATRVNGLLLLFLEEPFR